MLSLFAKLNLVISNKLTSMVCKSSGLALGLWNSPNFYMSRCDRFPHDQQFLAFFAANLLIYIYIYCDLSVTL